MQNLPENKSSLTSLRTRTSELWGVIRKPLISAFVIFYIFISAFWLMPNTWRWRNAVLHPLEPFILYMGLWQSFAVFSPDPRKINLHLVARVLYDDGTVGIFAYPRMEQLPMLDRSFRERWRKYGHDYLNWDAHKNLWPDFCRWVARKSVLPGKTPMRVSLVRYWADIPPPEKGLGIPPPPQSNEFLFYTYGVKAEDLK